MMHCKLCIETVQLDTVKMESPEIEWIWLRLRWLTDFNSFAHMRTFRLFLFRSEPCIVWIWLMTLAREMNCLPQNSQTTPFDSPSLLWMNVIWFSRDRADVYLIWNIQHVFIKYLAWVWAVFPFWKNLTVYHSANMRVIFW